MAGVVAAKMKEKKQKEEEEESKVFRIKKNQLSTLIILAPNGKHKHS